MQAMKKIASMFLALVLCLGMAMPAMAASSSDTGSITVNGLENGVTVSAYQIAKATYDTSTGQFLGYSMVVNAGGFSIGADGSYDESTLTEANLSALYAALSGASATGSATADGSGTAVIENLPVGSYLLVVTGSESTTYALMIGSVSYTTEGIENGELSVVSGNTWAKATTPQISKTEAGGSLGDDFEHGGSADLGDELTYHITVNNIPAYYGNEPEFAVTDALSTNLSISDKQLEGLVITIDGATLTAGTDYTVTKSENGFVVDFVVGGNYTLNDYAGKSLVIEYKATVATVTDEDADDHTNKATLDYTTNSYATGQDAEIEDSDHDFTFSVKMQKTDTNKNALEGAAFTLYTDDACASEYTQDGQTVTATSASDGYFTFSGLEEGTYYMKETVAPNGYTLNTIIYKVVISAEYSNDGTITNWTIAITDDQNNAVGSAVNTSATNAVIPNTQVSSLPSTGGMGTMMFTIGGCILILAAVLMIVIFRRRSANTD